MLIERFVISTFSAKPAASSTVSGDHAIYVYQYQPMLALISTFKKNSSKPKCLAATASHVFAAQANQGIVNVYNRDRCHQESIVVFPTRIFCIAYVGNPDGAGLLALGTEEGTVILWEVLYIYLMHH